MARYRAAVCKLCRREGEKLFLKGSRCQTAKCAIVKKRISTGATWEIASDKKIV